MVGIFLPYGCANVLLNLGLTDKSSLPVLTASCCESQWLHVVCLVLQRMNDLGIFINFEKFTWVTYWSGRKKKPKPSLFFCPATGPTSSLVILKKSVTKCFLSGTRGKENRCFLCIMLLILLQRSIYRVGKYREWPASLTSLIKNIINHTYNSLNSSVTLLLYWATGY